MPSVVGTWDLRITWIRGRISGVELPGSYQHNFNADGTWTSPDTNNYGRWLQAGDFVMWDLVSDIPFNLMYSGKIRWGTHAADAASMTGMMAKWIDGGDYGTFSASRESQPPDEPDTSRSTP